MSDKGEPFYALPAAFMRRTRISIVGKVVYCYLVDRLRLIERFPGRFPYPTERSIAAALGTTERAVRRTLARLKSANVIEVERPKGKATNRYKLLLDTGRNVLNTPDETSAEHRTSRPHNTGRNVLNTADETSALLQNSEIQNTHNGACSAVEQAFRAAFANGRTLTRPRLAEIQVAARDWAAAGYSPDLVAPALADLKRKYELIGPLGLVKHVNEYDRMAQSRRTWRTDVESRMSEQAARTVMPQNWDAEYSLIGSLCCDARAAFPTVLAFIPDETWLSHPDTRVAWRCLRAMYDADEPIDLITVSDRLERMGPPANDRESWAAVMTRFSETVPTWLNAASYARIVAAYALMRQMVQVGLNLQDAASLTKSTSKPIELLAAAQNLARDTARDLEDLAAIIRAQEPDDLADLMRDLAADLEAGTPGRLPTEIMPIDGLTGGLQRGGVTIIGARTSVGKTSLAVTIAKNALREGKRVLFITAEMSSKRIAGRFVAMMTSTPCADIFGDGDSAAGLAAIHSAEQQLARDGVYVRYMNSMREIAPTARWYVERRNVELIIVDYLQLCLPAEQQQTRALAVASMSRAIRAVAIRTGAAMLVLSQFNREACRDGTPPKMSDLYESAAIEQDADGVILLHVPTPRDGPYQDMQAIIPKNRDGKKGTVQIRAYYPSMEFRSGYED